jgi:hypothetical protein
MKYMVTIDYRETDDPIRNEHGLSKLLAYAEELDALMEESPVRLVLPVIWDCYAPVGYAVLEAEEESDLQPFVARFGHHPKVSVRMVRLLDEVMELARDILATKRASN